MGVRNKEGHRNGRIVIRSSGRGRRSTVPISVVLERCDWLPMDCTHNFLASIQDEYIKYTATLFVGRDKRQRRLYSQGLRIFPFDMTFSQSCSVLPFLACFWNSNVIKWVLLSFWMEIPP